ncbi:alpha/beta fold hydrolase [Maribellus mangrovi]|uniref:alpha/beta fold hydrolase n=1 Tax=Maribellus mangrovi TaxID=3133146 RepID=UPI0030EF798D
MKTMKQFFKLSIFVWATILIFGCSKDDFYEMDEPGQLVPLTVDENPDLPSITINGTMLHSEAFGNPEDPMIVVLHGGPGGDYRSLLCSRDLVDDGYYIVFYDQRGSGLSQRHDADQFTVQMYIDDLEAVIDYYRYDENQKVILLTHSWGSMLAAGYVNQYPDAIDGIVLAEPGGLTFDQMEEYLSRSNQVEFFKEATNDAIFPEQIFAGRNEHEILDYKALYFLSFENAEGNTIGNAGPYPFWRNGAVAHSASLDYVVEHGFDFKNNLGNYSPKVLFMYSERNEAYGENWAEEVAAPFPNKEIQIVLGAGHEMFYFGWEDMYPKVLSYLNEIQ